ncbi:MAG: nicotinate (nicotinamide) nucleotide adenylyltransferase [Phycisphaerae bacterium]|nr:nicotinate (nicotinamide) nucleotide adenylyltransferase [Phycisphaerae bacterium]
MTESTATDQPGDQTPLRDTRPIVVFGGSFDPPHCRHVVVAQGAVALTRCKRLLIVPAFTNPQRNAPQASVQDRLAMCTLAFASLPDATVSSVEVDQGKPCFTVDTLERLHAQQAAGELPSGPFRLLMGSDQALNFRSWKDWERLATLAEPAVVLRPPHAEWEWKTLLLRAWDDAWTQRWLSWTLPIDPVDVASTDVRRRVAAGESIADLVPHSVAAYIAARGLYRG